MQPSVEIKDIYASNANMCSAARKIIFAFEAAAGFDYTKPLSETARAIRAEAVEWLHCYNSSQVPEGTSSDLPLYCDILTRISRS